MKLRDNKCIINYAILLLGAKLDTTREVFSEAHKIIKFIVLHLPTDGTLGFVFSYKHIFFLIWVWLNAFQLNRDSNSFIQI